MNSTRRTFLQTCSMLTGACVLQSGALLRASESASGSVSGSESESESGKPYCGWKQGEMDLHFILTGVGESMFHIYPDGTTLLLDAGERDITKYADNVPAFPDASRTASEWIMRYLERVNPAGKNIDYMMLSHFHSDHAGEEGASSGKTSGRGEDYGFSGLANIGEHFTFKKVYDRGFPTYDSPIPMKSDGYENFVRFTKYMLSQKRFEMEEFEVGKCGQIALLHAPEQFSDFHIRNICRNGVVWTGEEGKTRDFYAENPDALKGWVNENSMSLGMTVEYGPFRYFTGGDLSGDLRTPQGTRVNIEEYAGTVIGELDVCKTNHHSYKDAMVSGFTSAVKANVYVSNVWDLHHLQDNTMTNMVSASPDALICPTVVHAKAYEKYTDRPWLRNLAPESVEGGHVVVKVFDGGRQYKVYYLTAKDESMTVRKVYGPFTSKKA